MLQILPPCAVPCLHARSHSTFTGRQHLAAAVATRCTAASTNVYKPRVPRTLEAPHTTRSTHPSSKPLQIIAVQKSGRKWHAWRLGHRNLSRAKRQIEQADAKQSLRFTRLEVTSGLVWIETSNEDCPQYLRDVVPERPVRWSSQLAPCNWQTAQAMIATPLAGARCVACVHKLCAR